MAAIALPTKVADHADHAVDTPSFYLPVLQMLLARKQWWSVSKAQILFVCKELKPLDGFTSMLIECLEAWNRQRGERDRTQQNGKTIFFTSTLLISQRSRRLNTRVGLSSSKMRRRVESWKCHLQELELGWRIPLANENGDFVAPGPG